MTPCAHGIAICEQCDDARHALDERCRSLEESVREDMRRSHLLLLACRSLHKHWRKARAGDKHYEGRLMSIIRVLRHEGAGDEVIEDVIERVIQERDEARAQRDALAEALRASYDFHRRVECPTYAEGHGDSSSPLSDCTCTAFDAARAALAKVEGKP